MTIKQLMQKRAAMVAEARAVLDKAEGESRALDGEESARHSKIIDDIGALSDSIKSLEKQKELERSIAEDVGKDHEERGGSGNTQDRTELLMAAARSYITTGKIDPKAELEWRDLQAGSNAEGGFLVMPEQFVNQLIKFMDDSVFIRGLATVFQVPTAASLGAPSLDADVSDADWTTELDTGNEDTTMAFGKRNLHPHPVAKLVKISRQLIRQAMMNPETLVQQRLAYKFAITEEKAFLTGTGAGQPLGLFTASAQGISTGRDVSTDNTTTAITFDGLINALYSLKVQYHKSAAWVFHRDAIKQIAKIKDGDDNYIWQPSVVPGRPDMILGRPLTMSEYVPNTFTTGQYVGMIADFSHYWVADAMDMQVQRLDELYARTNQVGFIGRKETDGMPVLEEAFARVTLA